MRKNYFWYLFFRYGVVGTGLRFFYSKYTSSGLEKVPKDKPLLFVPNHQNSFMDALLVANTSSAYLYFLTRAEAFKPAPLGWFLRSLNMLPVYRVRDGFSSVQKNNAIFDECFDHLADKCAVLVFAEANHNLKRRIRPLSKGFTRIAFGAEEKYNWDLDLQVVPVGLNYSCHRESRNHVHVHYGDPIPVKEYREQFLEDANEASQVLKDRVSEEMKKLTMHVESLGNYPLHQIVLDDLEDERDRILRSGYINEKVEKLEELASDKHVEDAKSLQKDAEKAGLSIRELASPPSWKLRDVMLLPVYLFSFINNIIPYQPVRYLISNIIKDHAFDASIKFLAGLAILPLFYTIVAGILMLSGVEGTSALLYILVSLFTAPAFIRARELFTPSPSSKLKRTKPKRWQELNERLEAFRLIRKKVMGE